MKTETFQEAVKIQEEIKLLKHEISCRETILIELLDVVNDDPKMLVPVDCPITGIKFMVEVLDFKNLLVGAEKRIRDKIADLEFNFKGL